MEERQPPRKAYQKPRVRIIDLTVEEIMGNCYKAGQQSTEPGMSVCGSNCRVLVGS